MQRAAISSRFLMGSFSSRKWSEAVTAPDRGALYHHQWISTLLDCLSDAQRLVAYANHLVSAAEHAHVFRHMAVVERVSDLLADLPLPPVYSSIATYFKAVCIRSRSFADLSRSTELLESVLAKAPARYRSRALLSLGANATYLLDTQSGLRFYLDAARFAMSKECFDPVVVFQARKMLTVLKSLDGNHRGALVDLEGLHSIARRVGSWHSHVYYDYLNSLAVELAGAGRFEEAANASRLVGASPFACFREYSETREDIEQKRRGASRSCVPGASVAPLPSEFPVRYPIERNNIMLRQSTSVAAADQPRPEPRRASAQLLIFPDRKAQAAEYPAPTALPRQTVNDHGPMTASEKRAAVASLFLDERTPNEVLDRMLEAAGVALSDELLDQGPRHLDLESPGELEELTIRWLNGAVEPEELAAVLSALRDCDDHLRRTSIIDQMISYAFAETTEHLESESDWRGRVEARLTSAT